MHELCLNMYFQSKCQSKIFAPLFFPLLRQVTYNFLETGTFLQVQRDFLEVFRDFIALLLKADKCFGTVT